MSSGRVRELLYVGRPVPEKGLPDLLSALAFLGDLRWHLSVAGELPDAVSSVDESNISFLGRVCHGQMPALMQRHDVLVVPSRYETFGNVALEGLAVAMIVLAARTGGLKSLITNGHNGFHFTPGNVTDLANKLRLVVTSFDRLEQVRRNARAHALRYSWDSVTHATAQLLETLI